MRLLQYLAVAAEKIDPGSIPALDANVVFANALNIVYMTAGAVAVFVIIFAGFTYVTANGDAAKISRAKNEIMYAVVGLVVVILAFIITQFIIGRF
ncbi:MAG TPA: hypothetical protein VFD55_01310 [Candidatus Angelobacter sp.]|nr:hypothetical protein [Candidatus Angelobacter sp.]